MDEINEKAIKDIIDYYDNLEDVHETEDKSEEKAPELVDIVEGAIAEKNTAEEDPVEEKAAEEPTAFVLEEDEDTADAEEALAAQTEEETEQSEEGGTEEEENKEEISFIEEQTEEVIAKPGHKKSRGRWKIIIAVVLAAALIGAFVTVDTGFIGTYKRNVSKNVTIILNFFGVDLSRSSTGVKKTDDKTPRYKASVKDTVVVPMETAGQSVFASFRENVACAYTNYLSVIAADGSTVWENPTTIVNPMLKTAGNYILIAENGGKKLCLYNDSRLVYETDTEDNILNCSLSSNGDVVVVTEKSAYKGAIVVFNRDGNQIFAWSSGSDNIISADISATSRRVAVALLNTDDKVRSTVELFDIKETKSPAQVIFEDTIIFNVEFNGDTLGVIGDNCIAGMTSNGDLLYDKRFDGVEFVHYGTDREGNKILLFDNTNIPLINIYNSSAELKNQISPEELPDFVDISGRYIVYNSGRDIIFGKADKKRFKKYIASMDIKQLMMLDNSTIVIVYSNNIEIVKV